MILCKINLNTTSESKLIFFLSQCEEKNLCYDFVTMNYILKLFVLFLLFLTTLSVFEIAASNGRVISE
jgi:hypothetical protein